MEHRRAPSRDAEARFEALAQIAGGKLTADFGDTLARYPEVAAEDHPVRRWYKALQYIGGRESINCTASSAMDSGNPAGLILLGSIEKPAAASATLCLRPTAHLPEREVASSRW